MAKRSYSCIVYGDPVGTAYLASTRQIRKNGKLVQVPQLVKTRDARLWMATARPIAKVATGGGGLLKGPLRLDVTAYLRRPKRLIYKRKPMPSVVAPVKPDRTNILKLAEDSMKGIWWKDDNVVVAGEPLKFYAAGEGYGDPRPRVEIQAWEIEEGNE